MQLYDWYWWWQVFSPLTNVFLKYWWWQLLPSTSFLGKTKSAGTSLGPLQTSCVRIQSVTTEGQLAGTVDRGSSSGTGPGAVSGQGISNKQKMVLPLVFMLFTAFTKVFKKKLCKNRAQTHTWGVLQGPCVWGGRLQDHLWRGLCGCRGRWTLIRLWDHVCGCCGSIWLLILASGCSKIFQKCPWINI